MSKYFKEEKEESILISTYIERLKEKDYTSGRDIYEAEYLIEILGDIDLPSYVISVLCDCFHSFGGRYSVRSDDETIKGIYEIWQEYEFLSSSALDSIAFIYIKDLFDKYSLKEKLGEYISLYGMSDDTFEKYYSHIKECADELQEDYIIDAKKLEDDEFIKDSYSDRFIKYLIFDIKFKHYSIDKILECLPSPELVKKDEKQLDEIVRRSHDYFGACYPTSYSMTSDLVKYGKLDFYDEQPSYYVSISKKSIPTTFTKTDFLESTKYHKDKILEK